MKRHLLVLFLLVIPTTFAFGKDRTTTPNAASDRTANVRGAENPMEAPTPAVPRISRFQKRGPVAAPDGPGCDGPGTGPCNQNQEPGWTAGGCNCGRNCVVGKVGCQLGSNNACKAAAGGSCSDCLCL
jgi:hypothetical protein